MTEPTTPRLTEDAVREIEAAFPNAEYQPALSPDDVGPCEICKGTIDDHKANCPVTLVHLLIRDWRAMQAENRQLCTSFEISEANRTSDNQCHRDLMRTKEAENADLEMLMRDEISGLRQQLAQVTSERDEVRRLLRRQGNF